MNELEILKEKIKNATGVRHIVGTDKFTVIVKEGLIAETEAGDLVQMFLPDAVYEFRFPDEKKYDF